MVLRAWARWIDKTLLPSHRAYLCLPYQDQGSANPTEIEPLYPAFFDQYDLPLGTRRSVQTPIPHEFAGYQTPR